MTAHFLNRIDGMSDDGSIPAPQIDIARGRIVTVTLPSGAYVTYIMDYRVTDSMTGELIAEAQGLSLHTWLNNATPEEIAYVGAGVVDRIAMFASGAR